MDKELQEFIAKQKEMVISSYEQAKNYSNLIMMGGYAGLFAVWNFTKNDIEPWQSLTVGLLAIFSVLSFVLFEIYGIWLQTTQTFNLISKLQEAEKLNKFPKDYGKQGMLRAERLAKVWPYFFFVTLCSGISAGGLLIWSFVEKLVCGQ
jgi:hypothetical protein